MILNRGCTEPRNISLTEALKDCRILKLGKRSAKLIWSGYGNDCDGGNTSELSMIFALQHRMVTKRATIRYLYQFNIETSARSSQY